MYALRLTYLILQSRKVEILIPPEEKVLKEDVITGEASAHALNEIHAKVADAVEPKLKKRYTANRRIMSTAGGQQLKQLSEQLYSWLDQPVWIKHVMRHLAMLGRDKARMLCHEGSATTLTLFSDAMESMIRLCQSNSLHPEIKLTRSLPTTVMDE